MKHKKMVTTFNKTDLVKFGNFLMEEVQSGDKKPQADGEYRVSHADIEKWMVDREIEAIRSWKSITEDDLPENKKEAFRMLKPHIDGLISSSIDGKEILDILKEQE